MNQMLTSQENFSRAFLRRRATDLFSKRVLLFPKHHALPQYPAVAKPQRGPDWLAQQHLGVLQDTAAEQMAIMMRPTLTGIEDKGQGTQRAAAVLTAAFIEIVALMPIEAGVHWLGTVDLIYSTVKADLNTKRRTTKADVTFADVTKDNIATFGADDPMSAFWSDFVDMVSAIIAKIAMEYVNHAGAAEAMADAAKSAPAIAAMLSSDRFKALMSEHFQTLIAEQQDITRANLGLNDTIDEDAAEQARDAAARDAGQVAREVAKNDGALSDDAMAGNNEPLGLDADDPDDQPRPKSRIDQLMAAIQQHADLNVSGDWTLDHVAALTAAVTSAPPLATDPYDSKLLLQHIANVTKATAWTESQRQLIRWLVRNPESSPEQLAEFVANIRTSAEDRAKANLLPSHQELHNRNRAYGSLAGSTKLRFHHGNKDAAMRIRITKAFQSQSVGGFADNALVACSRSLQKAVKESAKTAASTGDNSAAIGAAVAS